MGVCDLCNKQIDAMAKQYSASEIRAAAAAGLRPESQMGDMSAIFGMSQNEMHAGWLQLVANETSNWAVCSSCAERVKSFLSKNSAPAKTPVSNANTSWSGIVYSVRNADGTESEYLELPAFLPEGTKYWTYEITGPAIYPVSNKPLNTKELQAVTKALTDKGYTFKNTTPFGGHIVGVSSENRPTLGDLVSLGKKANQQKAQSPEIKLVETQPAKKSGGGFFRRLKDIFSK